MALDGLVQQRLLPHLQALAQPACPEDWPTAARRLQRLTSAMPAAWRAPQGGGRALGGLLELARGLGRLLQAAAAFGQLTHGYSAEAATDVAAALGALGAGGEAAGLKAAYGGA
jgi:hypothetical protein